MSGGTNLRVFYSATFVAGMLLGMTAALAWAL